MVVTIPVTTATIDTEVTLQVGQSYSRHEIAALVGGGVLESLPHVVGTVVAACLDPWLNPRAPTEMVVGPDAYMLTWAQRFVAQGGDVPVFLREGDKVWRYVGRYRVTASTTDPHALATRARSLPHAAHARPLGMAIDLAPVI